MGSTPTESGTVVGKYDKTLVTQTVWQRRVLTLSLAAGALAIAVAAGFAHTTPASGYEVSVYAGTPIGYWVALVLGVTAAIAVVGYDRRPWARRTGLFIAGLGVASMLGLPILRGYHFYGSGDSLTHLGQARIMTAGFSTVFSVIYPGPYSYAFAFSGLAGLPVREAMLYVVFVFSLLFLVALPASIRALFNSTRGDAVAVVSALLILPINNISTSLVFKPVVQAILFTPIVFLFLFRHVQRTGEDDTLPRPVSAAAIALLVSTTALNFFHPQIVVDMLILFGAVSGIQFVLRRVRPTHPLAQKRAIYGQFALLLAMFLLWHTQHWKFLASVQNMVEAFGGFVQGSEQVGKEPAAQADSAQEIGANPVVLALKLMGTQFVYMLLAALLVVGHLTGRISRAADDEMVVTYFTLGGLAMAPYLFLQFLGSLSNYLFRHLGFVMVMVTIIAVSTLLRGRDHLSRRLPRPTIRTLGIVAAIVLLVLSLSVIYPSPYIYSPNQQVTEQHLRGYQSSFEATPEDSTIWYGGIRTGVIREKVGTQSAPGASWDGVVYPFPKSGGPIPGEAMDSPAQYYETHPEPVVRRDTYIPVEEQARVRAIEAHDGLRYTEADFEAMEHNPRTYRIRSNGGFTLYYVDTGCDPSCAPKNQDKSAGKLSPVHDHRGDRFGMAPAKHARLSSATADGT